MDRTKCNDFKTPRSKLIGMLPSDRDELCSAGQHKSPIAHPIRDSALHTANGASTPPYRPLAQWALRILRGAGLPLELITPHPKPERQPLSLRIRIDFHSKHGHS